MKRIIAFLILILITSGCASSSSAIIPVETLFAQTLVAMQLSATPTSINTFTYEYVNLPTLVPEAITSVQGWKCLPDNTERVKARVVKVIDGDTIEVAISNDVYKVNYIGVNAPAATIPFERLGPQALAFNEKLVGGQKVTLVNDIQDSDESGNLLRYVLVGDTFVNYELVRQGYASAVGYTPQFACDLMFMEAETQARSEVAGLWAPTAIPTDTPKPNRTATPRATVGPTQKPVCNCYGNYSCKNFKSQSAAQACFEYCKSQGLGDILGLDKNNNGKACEGSS